MLKDKLGFIEFLVVMLLFYIFCDISLLGNTIKETSQDGLKKKRIIINNSRIT